jgi:hypothetical protein
MDMNGISSRRDRQNHAFSKSAASLTSEPPRVLPSRIPPEYVPQLAFLLFNILLSPQKLMGLWVIQEGITSPVYLTVYASARRPPISSYPLRIIDINLRVEGHPEG